LAASNDRNFKFTALGREYVSCDAFRQQQPQFSGLTRTVILLAQGIHYIPAVWVGVKVTCCVICSSAASPQPW
ncbi:MAG: hypothetical protein WAN75_02935, partial [Xanthobacteraceae bacterium]